jgi:methyl acetate hydrolase
MADLDKIIGDAVAQHDAPFLVAMTGNRAGVTWSGAAGHAAPGQAASLDTVFRIFSMIKAVGSMAAMMLMNCGKLSANATVQSILPEFAEMNLLEGFDAEGKPILRAPKVQATVRHFATHTSGLAYEFWNANMGRYMAATEHPSVLAGTKQSACYPLQFEPGTRCGTRASASTGWAWWYKKSAAVR